MDTLIASTRQGLGKEAAKKLRSSQEQIPAVLYGFGVANSTSLTLDYRTLEKALAGPKKLNGSFNLSIDDQAFGQPVSAVVPLAVTGRSPGVQAGGRLRTPYREVTVSCVPSIIPAAIEVDITPLNQGDAIMASQVSLAEGVKLVYDRDFIVAKVLLVRAKKK
jgi:large subunit ribosomal protein L25